MNQNNTFEELVHAHLESTQVFLSNHFATGSLSYTQRCPEGCTVAARLTFG